jgi:hypothetical protein
MSSSTQRTKAATNPAIPHMIVRLPTLHLAFALTELEQVVTLPPIAYSATGILGLAPTPDDRAPGQMIVIDLYHRLYGNSLADPAHLLLFRAGDGLLYGLPVADFPEIQAIPADCFDQPRDTHPDGVELTRQMIKRPTPMGEQTLFIIDGDSLAQEARHIAADER